MALKIIWLLFYVLETPVINAKFVTEDGSPVNVDITREEEIQFRNEYGLVPDMNLTVQETPANKNVFKYGNRMYGDNADPLDVFTNDATYTHNGVAGNLPTSRIFQEADNDGKRVTISKDIYGETQVVMVVDDDGSVEELASIAPGVFVSIKPGDYDVEDMLSRFGYADIGGAKTFGNPIFPSKTDIGGCHEYRLLELAVVYDVSFCKEYGGTQKEADNQAIFLVALVSSRNQQDNFCLKVEISHLEGYCDATKDPYREMIALGVSGCRSEDEGIGLLPNFQNYWNANRTSISRDTVALLTGTPMDCGQTCIVGCAKMDSTCIRQKAYSVTWATFIKSAALRSSVLAHEIAHNNGAPHYNEEKGYIMNSFASNSENGFSRYSISQINRHFSLVSCIEKFVSNTPTSSPIGNNLFTENDAEPCKQPFRNFLKFSPFALVLLCLYPLLRCWQRWQNRKEGLPLALPSDTESQSDQMHTWVKQMKAVGRRFSM